MPQAWYQLSGFSLQVFEVLLWPTAPTQYLAHWYPPKHLSRTLDALWRHWKRSCWINDMWRQADKNSMVLQPLNSHGWTITDGHHLTIDWDSMENIKAIQKRVSLLTKGCRPKGHEFACLRRCQPVLPWRLESCDKGRTLKEVRTVERLPSHCHQRMRYKS